MLRHVNAQANRETLKQAALALALQHRIAHPEKQAENPNVIDSIHGI